MYKERKGMIIVVLVEIKKLVSYIMIKFFLWIEIILFFYYFGFFINYKEMVYNLKEIKWLGKFIIFRK